MNDLTVWFTSIDDVVYPEGNQDPKVYPSEWSTYLGLLDQKDQNKVTSFLFSADKRRALISVLIQNAIIREFLRIETNNDFFIKRTREVN